MRIIIEHNGVKRVLEGDGFNICGSAVDLRRIADAIQSDDLAIYGWVKVRDTKPDPHFAGANVEPLPWGKP